jgi:hypothetical protein
MSFEAQQRELCGLCSSLLRDGAVEAVIGFGARAESCGVCPPLLVKKEEDARKLVWNDRCVPNLAPYLPLSGKTAIVAKPCDARAVVNLIVERQISRESVHIIGMDCAGMTGADGNPLRACVECGDRRAPTADDIITGEIGLRDEWEDAGSDGGLQRFKDEMKKCILCFSCRQACYGCYCRTCFADRVLPNWQPAAPGLGAKMAYHLGRAMHLAGRCVGCGACENACASGVDVRYIIRGVSKFIEKEYGFRAGVDIDASPVMQSYSMDDRDVGFWGGDEREQLDVQR